MLCFQLMLTSRSQVKTTLFVWRLGKGYADRWCCRRRRFLIRRTDKRQLSRGSERDSNGNVLILGMLGVKKPQNHGEMVSNHCCLRTG